MRAWITVGLVAAWAAGAAAAEPPPGRTDGPEGSEIGKGGYPRYRTPGVFFVEPYFGAATVDVEPEGGGLSSDQTDLIYGANLGYLMEDWLGFQVGYGYIAGDQKASLFGAGIRNLLVYEPFNYFLRLDAEIYAPDVGDARFGLAPGAGAEVVLTERVRAGLQYQHDFIFADDSISINRFTARLQLKF